MPTESTPRINSRHLSSFPHSTIRLLGRVTSLHGETAILDAGGSVTVHLNRDAHLTLNSAVEIVGKVQPDMSIKVFQATDFGTNIDFKAVEAVVDATHRYKEIFYDAGAD